MTFIRQREETGSGQPIVALVENDFLDPSLAHLCKEPIPGYRVIVLEVKLSDGGSDAVAAEVIRFFDAVAIKQATLLGVGSAGTVALSLSLGQRKRVRRLILIDSPVRPGLTRREKVMSWLEHRLPLGLPLRRVAKGFDGRSYLQRIRCPTLVVTTPSATADIRLQAETEGTALATAWFYDLSLVQEFREKLRTFLDVPAKRPQKNRDIAIPAI